jgi:hypothetical protein
MLGVEGGDGAAPMGASKEPPKEKRGRGHRGGRKERLRQAQREAQRAGWRR